jgi:hypothetical protein
MSEIQQSVASTTAPAPNEPNISVEHPFTHVFHVLVSGVALDKTLAEILEGQTTGWGRADLVKVQGKFVTSDAKQFVKVGFTSTTSNATIDEIAMRPSGKYFVSSQATAGQEHTFDLIPEDIYSRQIQPASSYLPMLRLKCSTSAGVAGSIMLYVKVHGIIQIQVSLN